MLLKCVIICWVAYLYWKLEFATIIWPFSFQFSSVQSLSRVQLFATPWIAAHQASLSITNSRSSLRLTSESIEWCRVTSSPPTPIESVVPSGHLILCRPLLFLSLNPSQHQSLFQWVTSSHEVAKVLDFQLSHHFLPKSEFLLLGGRRHVLVETNRTVSYFSLQIEGHTP